jgi:hypothetical protein
MTKKSHTYKIKLFTKPQNQWKQKETKSKNKGKTYGLESKRGLEIYPKVMVRENKNKRKGNYVIIMIQ